MELDYSSPELAEEALHNYGLMNHEQKAVFNAIKHAVDNGKGGIFAINAPGGTGKTFVVKTILAYVRGKSQIALAMATSGIAAILLPGGRTVHSKLHVPIELDDNSLCSIKDRSAAARLVKRCSLMVIDEVTMGDRRLFETVDRTLKQLMEHPDKPFGGMTLVVSGDWRQCLPVVHRGSPSLIMAHTLKKSELWSNVSYIFHFPANGF